MTCAHLLLRIRNTTHNTTQHNTTQHNTTQHNTTQHNTTQHRAKKQNTTENHGTVYTAHGNTCAHNTDATRRAHSEQHKKSLRSTSGSPWTLCRERDPHGRREGRLERRESTGLSVRQPRASPTGSVPRAPRFLTSVNSRAREVGGGSRGCVSRCLQVSPFGRSKGRRATHARTGSWLLAARSRPQAAQTQPTSITWPPALGHTAAQGGEAGRRASATGSRVETGGDYQRLHSA
jgi:hypothetical protein